jgi:hypothetical protein
MKTFFGDYINTIEQHTSISTLFHYVNDGSMYHTIVWKSSTPASKKGSQSDCKALPVRAIIRVFTPINRSCLVAFNMKTATYCLHKNTVN